MGNSVYSETPSMDLPKGRYTVTIRYESVGGGKAKCVYEEGRYGSELTGFVLLSEDAREISFPVTVRDYRRSLVVQCYQRESRTDSDYILIRSVQISTATNAKALRLIWLLLLFIIADGLLFALSRKPVRMAIREHAPVLVIFGITVFLTSLPVFTDYLPGKTLDLEFHMTRIAGLSQGLKEGMFPVRIQPGWLNGHGYAVSVFYGDILLYFPALLVLLGIPLQTAYQCFVLAVNIGTIWITFYCSKKMTGDWRIAMFAAILYTGNLYRITALYMRAAVGAYCAMIFFPLVILGLYDIFRVEKPEYEKGALALIIGFSGILETHIISFEMAVAFTALLCLILFKRTLQRKRLFTLCGAAIVTILINLWFLVPFLDYLRDDFQINYAGSYAGTEYKLQERGLFLSQIFLTDYEVISRSNGVTMGIQGEMPLTIGMGLTMVLAAGILLLAYQLQRGEKRKELWLCMCMVFFSFALTLHCFPYIFLGRLLPPLRMLYRSIQYNWRFLTISAALLLWMFCIVGKELMQKGRNGRIIFLCMSAGICTFCILQAMDFESTVLNEMDVWRVYSAENLSMESIGGGEYLPVDTDLDSLKNEVTSTDSIFVENWERNGKVLECTVQNKTGQEAGIELPLLFYRYYEAESGGISLELERAEDGRVRLLLPEFFTGTVTISFREPALWRISEVFSVMGVLLVVIVTGKKRYKGLGQKLIKRACN